MCDPAGAFCQTLDLATSTVTVVTPSLSVNVSIDLNSPLLGPNGQPTKEAGIVRVHAVGTNGSKFGLTVTLEPYRTEQPAVFGGPFYQHACYPRFEHPDAIDTISGADAVTWVHWNHINTTFFNDTVRDQGIDPSEHPDLIDPFTHRAFGGQISGKGLTAVKGSGGLAVSTGKDEELASVEVQVKLLTQPDTDPTTWRATIDKLQPAPAPADGALPINCKRGGTAAWTEVAGCATTWEEIVARSYVQVEEVTSETVDHSRSAAENITTHAVWDRYLSLIQGRSAYAPIKFNGQGFLSDQAGKGWDLREWGIAYWWQGTRHPYYNALTAGDSDTMRSMLDFYTRMLPYTQARSAAQWSGEPMAGGALTGNAALFEEVTTQFGTYHEGNWGCPNKNASHSAVNKRPYGASNNRFIRFHFTGSLEMSLMALDLYDATQSEDDLTAYLPLVAAVVEGFRQRFPNKDAEGKIDMWPSQALETYGCHNITGGSENGGKEGAPNRETCMTNPSTDISGTCTHCQHLI